MSFSEESSVGASVLIRGINCSQDSPVLLHSVYLKSNLVTGPVKVEVQPSLQFEGVHLILGNHLMGDKVVVNAVATEKNRRSHLERSISALSFGTKHQQVVLLVLDILTIYLRLPFTS